MKLRTCLLAAWLATTGGAAFAASTSPTPIAVLDVKLDTRLDAVDGGDKVHGTLTVFEAHTTPLRSDKTLDLTQIRRTKASLTGIDIQLKTRGAFSLTNPKKQYSLDVDRNPLTGVKNPIPLLNMLPDTEWVLHSCYIDATCLRNVVGYWQASRLFPWAPHTEFAEVFINDEYRGLYVVVERIKLGDNRVNSPAPSDSDKTGTYVLKQDQGDADFDWTTYTLGTPWWLVSPKAKDLTSAQFSYIQSLTQLVDLRPKTYIDQDSLANYIIMQELTGNIDGYYRSMYFTKMPSLTGGVPLHLGPIWDLDTAFENYHFCTSDQWRMRSEEPDGEKRMFRPLYTMWQDRGFRQLIQARWKGLSAQSTIAYEPLKQRIALLAARIKAARLRDNQKWDKRILPAGKCRSDEVTFDAAVANMQNWLSTRIAWLDRAFKDPNFTTP